MDLEKLLEKFNRNPPASKSAIETLQSAIHFPLPADYVEFLSNTDGGEGFIGNSYLMLWRAEDLIEMNLAYDTAEFAPGLFIFGSDGGNEGFCFDFRSPHIQIVSLPFVGMDIDMSLPKGANLKCFFETLFVE